MVKTINLKENKEEKQLIKYVDVAGQLKTFSPKKLEKRLELLYKLDTDEMFDDKKRFFREAYRTIQDHYMFKQTDMNYHWINYQVKQPVYI